MKFEELLTEEDNFANALAKKIFAKAEEMAFDSAEEGKQPVTGDMIHKQAQILVKDAMQQIDQMIRKNK